MTARPRAAARPTAPGPPRAGVDGRRALALDAQRELAHHRHLAQRHAGPERAAPRRAAREPHEVLPDPRPARELPERRRLAVAQFVRVHEGRRERLAHDDRAQRPRGRRRGEGQEEEEPAHGAAPAGQRVVVAALPARPRGQRQRRARTRLQRALCSSLTNFRRGLGGNPHQYPGGGPGTPTTPIRRGGTRRGIAGTSLRIGPARSAGASAVLRL